MQEEPAAQEKLMRSVLIMFEKHPGQVVGVVDTGAGAGGGSGICRPSGYELLQQQLAQTKRRKTGAAAEAMQKHTKRRKTGAPDAPRRLLSAGTLWGKRAEALNEEQSACVEEQSVHDSDDSSCSGYCSTCEDNYPEKATRERSTSITGEDTAELFPDAWAWPHYEYVRSDALAA